MTVEPFYYCERDVNGTLLFLFPSMTSHTYLREAVTASIAASLIDAASFSASLHRITLVVIPS